MIVLGIWSKLVRIQISCGTGSYICWYVSVVRVVVPVRRHTGVVVVGMLSRERERIEGERMRRRKGGKALNSSAIIERTIGATSRCTYCDILVDSALHCITTDQRYIRMAQTHNSTSVLYAMYS